MQKNPSLMIGVSGIRGVVGSGLTPEVVLRFSRAFGAYAGSGRVVVGRDSRPSGGLFSHAVFSGLLWAGCEPVDLGICPTPTIQVTVETLRARGGIAVTASHNPQEWNALKLIGPRGTFLSEEEGRRFLALHDTMLRESGQPGSRRVRWGSVSVYRDAIKDHLRRILDVVDSRTIRRRQLGIVLDCVHGAGGLLLVPLLEKLGCRVAVLHGEPTGLFPRDPEPRRENLEELCRRVKRDKADLGLAVDPDGDRLATVSERGEPLGEEMTLVLAAMEVLRAESGTVVTNLSTTRALEDVARGCGGRVVRTKVGEANVVSGMRRHRAVLGGEGNGGVIDPRVHYGRDAGVACGLILSLLARSGQRASQAARAAPRYFMRKSKIRVDRSAGLQQKLRCWRGGGVTDLRDGLRVDWDDGWIHLRPSGTEPVLRVIAEATSEARLNELHRMAIELVRCGRRE